MSAYITDLMEWQSLAKAIAYYDGSKLDKLLEGLHQAALKSDTEAHRAKTQLAEAKLDFERRLNVLQAENRRLTATISRITKPRRI